MRNNNLREIATEEDLDFLLWILRNLRDVRRVEVFKIGDDTVIYVDRYPILKRVEVRGNRGIGEEEIKSFLGLREGEPLIGFSEEAAEEALLRFYRDRGYVEAKVSVSLNVDEEGFADIKINVEEGELHFLGGAVFEGARSYTHRKLTEESGLEIGEVFNEELAKRGAKRLREFYRREGFLESFVYLKDIKVVRGRRPFPFVLSPGPVRGNFRDRVRSVLRGLSNFVSHPVSLLKALFGRGHFALPVYQIFEGRRYEVEFEGNEFLSDEELSALIDRRTAGVDHFFLEGLKRKIEEAYKKKGFFDVEVSYTYEEGRVVYKVKEGKRFRLVYEGPENIKVPEYYDEEAVRKAVEEAVEKLRREGYLTARAEVTKRVDKERKEVFLSVRIVRGKRVLIKDFVLVKGPKELRRVFSKYRAVLPTVLEESIIEELNKEIEEFFLDEGFLEGKFSVEVRVEEDEENMYLTYLYSVETGPRYTYGKLIVYGNEKTRLREISYTVVKHWHFSKEVEEESIWNLVRSGIFSGVSLEHFVDRKNKVVHRFIEVREEERGSFEVSLGYNTEERLKAEGSLTLKNLFGVGIVGRLSASKSELYETYEAGLSDRFLFSRKYFGDTALFRRVEFHRTFDLTSEGFSLSLGYRPTRWVEVGLSFSSTENEVVGFEEGKVSLRRAGLFLRAEVRDDPVNPKNIRHGSLSFSYAWGKRNYYRIIGNVFFLREITPRLSANLRIAGGLVGRDAPIFDRFFLGGLRDMRGYDFEVIGSPSGGRSFLFSRGELVVSLREPFRLALYTDAGSVGDTLGESLRSLKYDAGFAVGVGSPVGFVRVDFAFPLSRIPEPTPPFRVYLSIGFVY